MATILEQRLGSSRIIKTRFRLAKIAENLKKIQKIRKKCLPSGYNNGIIKVLNNNVLLLRVVFANHSQYAYFGEMHEK